MGVVLFFLVVIFGAYVLPTVLIGIVAISFDDATTKNKMLESMVHEMNRVVNQAKATMPTFITPNRIDIIRDLFEEMDADSEMTLDFNEVYVFMLYLFMCIFEVRVSREQAESLFQLMDSTARGEVNYGELVMFIVAIKQSKF